jgi:hypothetical protein
VSSISLLLSTVKFCERSTAATVLKNSNSLINLTVQLKLSYTQMFVIKLFLSSSSCSFYPLWFQLCSWTAKATNVTKWFKYDRDKLWLVYTKSVPVIFGPPCIKHEAQTLPYFIHVFVGHCESHDPSQNIRICTMLCASYKNSPLLDVQQLHIVIQKCRYSCR